MKYFEMTQEQWNKLSKDYKLVDEKGNKHALKLDPLKGTGLYPVKIIK